MVGYGLGLAANLNCRTASDRNPATNGACDAAAAGMGGVHFVPTDTKEVLLLWRQQFPNWIQ